MTKRNQPSYKQRLTPTIRPQDDFYGYVNSKWLRANPIPPSETYWGAFSVLNDESREHMRGMYEGLLGTQAPDGSLERQARDFYTSGMHFDEFEADHLALIAEYLGKIDAITQPAQLSRLCGELHQIGVDTPWRLVVDADDKDSSHHILRLMQPRLTLPDRDYYLSDDKTMQDIREKYQAHAAAVYRHFPALSVDAETFWKDIWEFEMDIARVCRTNVQLRDIKKNYHKVSFKKLASAYPAIDWAAYAAALGWDTSSRISADQPEYFEFINRQIHERPLEAWKTYLKWRVVVEFYGAISTPYAELKFDFFGRVLGGSKEILPLWKRVVATMNGLFGEGGGRLYAAKYFPESSKQQVLSLVEDIRAAYRERIANLEWMSQPTKDLAQQKLANMKVLIGYPDGWRDYSGLEIGSGPWLANIIAARRFDTAYWLGKLMQPTSRDDWFMNPQTVNAYNDPNRLVICFPAAILQPPFFDPAAPYAANIGSIGAIIGHEFTHGFDDQGCQFDAEGNVRTWQNPAERKAFAQRAQIIIKQADNFEVLPGLTLKGKLVIGESIADLGGLELAHHAFLAKKQQEKLEGTDGLSAEELFFVSFASTECGHSRDQRKRELALRDPHPNERFRVNAILSHCDSFYEAFSVTSSDALYRAPKDRARIW